MYTLLILFFGSLIGIIIMISQKLRFIAKGGILESEFIDVSPFDFQNIKNSSILNIKRLGGLMVVVILRGYVKATIFVKNKYDYLKNARNSRMTEGTEGEQKISKFLKIISEYKHKIRDIKEKIKEEENSL